MEFDVKTELKVSDHKTLKRQFSERFAETKEITFVIAYLCSNGAAMIKGHNQSGDRRWVHEQVEETGGDRATLSPSLIHRAA